MEIGEPHAFIVQAVEVRRFQHRVAVARQVAVALVVDEDEQNIRPGAGNFRDGLLGADGKTDSQ